ncbi:MAG: NADP-specific glutamate dehydrogenase [Bacteroidales bacterium]|nr:NADP-specific glutamate dehydrogenase [Bacteroidales bacterium]
MNVDKIMIALEKRNPNQTEYLQAVRDVLESIEDVYNENARFENASIIERLIEPDRILSFKVPWLDDEGKVQINHGYRIQYNNAIGPYKGGLRFHPSVNLSILKFLGFEQTLKNSLTTLPMGGAMGGADFDPKGKSQSELMRFCQSFMLEMWRIIGPDTDVPAGDIGVGSKEVGYLFGMYKKLSGSHNGVFTGKGVASSGSLIRSESSGYGAVYFVNEMLRNTSDSIRGKRVAISGFGNVSWGVAKKAVALGAKVVTISGPDGYIYDKNGLDERKVDYMLELRSSNEDIVKPYSYEFEDAEFHPGAKPWEVKCDIAFPCATENELDIDDARALIRNGCTCVCEGANMPCTSEAIDLLQTHKVLFAPGKAANAGGVATSGLEMTQNAMKISWSEEEVDTRLQRIMHDIHTLCATYGTREDGYVDYVKGANIAGFLKIANAMLEQGIV